MDEKDLSDWRNLETTTGSELADSSLQPSAIEIPGLTVLCHPDPDRVGEQTALVGLRRDGQAQLSRLAPDFKTPDGDHCGPLADPRLSRQPLLLTPRPGGGLTLDAGATRTRLTIGGDATTGERQITAEELETGVVLVLGGRIALLLHTQRPSVVRPPAFGSNPERSNRSEPRCPSRSTRG